MEVLFALVYDLVLGIVELGERAEADGGSFNDWD